MEGLRKELMGFVAVIGCVFVVGVLAFRRGFVGEAARFLKSFPI